MQSFYASYYNSEVFLCLQANVILIYSKLNPLHSAFLYPPLLKSPRKTPLYLQSLEPQHQEAFMSIPKRKTSHLSMTGLLSLHPLLSFWPWGTGACPWSQNFATHIPQTGGQWQSLFEGPRGRKQAFTAIPLFRRKGTAAKSSRKTPTLTTFAVLHNFFGSKTIKVTFLMLTRYIFHMCK